MDLPDTRPKRQIMLGYQHEYHAGNHADVLKHAVLALLIDALQRKPAPLRVLDTHAGSGAYDLGSSEAQRGREHSAGIARLLAAGPAPAELARYVAVVEAANSSGTLVRYPGSPALARALLRPDDQLELFELHPRAFAALESLFRGERRVHMHRRDGLEGLRAVVPPLERRGIALIDPSYETRDDFARVIETVTAAQRRWSNGIYAVWYPLIRKPEAAAFVRRLRGLALPRAYQVEIELASPGAPGLRGSGLVVANLPFGVDARLEALLPWLHRCLAQDGAGRWRAEWLRRE